MRRCLLGTDFSLVYLSILHIFGVKQCLMAAYTLQDSMSRIMLLDWLFPPFCSHA